MKNGPWKTKFFTTNFIINCVICTDKTFGRKPKTIFRKKLSRRNAKLFFRQKFPGIRNFRVVSGLLTFFSRPGFQMDTVPSLQKQADT